LVFGISAPQAWAWYQLRAAQSALARYHPAEARTALAGCERIWPSRASVRLLASRAARQAGDFDTASSELRECQRLSGGATEQTAFEWALLQAAAGYVREVEEYLQKRAAESPETDALVWEALAEGYLRVYRSSDAMACVNHWLNRDRDNVRALELRGMTYMTGRGTVKAAEDFTRVIELDPTRRESRWRLVGCLLGIGRYDEAAKHLEWLGREVPPGDPDISSRLGRCYRMMGRSEEGRRLVEEALRQHPDNGHCLQTLGQFEIAAGRLTEAETAFRKAVEALPEDYQSNWLLFQVLQQQGKVAEAKAQLAKAEQVKERTERLTELTSRKLTENPLDPGMHYETGAILMRSGREETALQWFGSALALDPNHAPTHAALAEYYERVGEKDKAELHRRAGRSTAP